MATRSRPLVAQQLSLALDGSAVVPVASPSSSPALAEDTPVGSRTHYVMLAGQTFVFRLRRGKRRTIGFQIDDAGLTVSAPRWAALREIEAAVVEKERWIRRKLAEWREFTSRRRLPDVRWAEGGALPYLGRLVTLRLSDRTELVGEHELHLALPPEAGPDRVKDATLAWLQTDARRVFGARIETLAAASGKRPSAWTLSSAKAQWGSCTHDGRIRLNWRLIHFAPAVIDYVIAHELAHLQELNHGPGFWNAVSRLLPGFETARDEIKGVDMASLPA